jgi:hypothetical protein
LVEKVSKRILRFLQRRGAITLVTAPGDGEVTVVTDESLGEKDPLLAKLLAAATAGAEPAGPSNGRQPIRMALPNNSVLNNNRGGKPAKSQWHHHKIELGQIDKMLVEIQVGALNRDHACSRLAIPIRAREGQHLGYPFMDDRLKSLALPPQLGPIRHPYCNSRRGSSVA